MSESSEANIDQTAADNLFSLQRVARLAKIEPDDPDRIQSQIQQILEFISILDELQLDEVEPFFGANELCSTPADGSSRQPIRADRPNESLTREQALKNAPVCDDRFYLVPPVFD